MAPSPPQDTGFINHNIGLLSFFCLSFVFLQSNANLVDISGSFASLATVRGFINIVVRSAFNEHTLFPSFKCALLQSNNSMAAHFDESSCPFRVTDLPVRQLSRFKPCPGQSRQTAFFPGLLITLIYGFRIIRG